MFDAIKNWFSPANESAPESQWDARTVQVQQPNSPATMNEAVSQQPENIDVSQQGPEGMSQVHMRGGGEGEDVCCGVAPEAPDATG
ncbi:hypothetical protein N7481_010529 [Penicillium waksmanii]|uniref:uncharacterized protein n=1 Tax=Penicillium waksmanii TaxID=69791 RepID=UPI0025495937|nr:uncharacterized protein N7481_010529 [Penicillium waksmanii]KAJ5973319.1 hypothetical protein N7481_010529 [Penicillium waksmanii]